MVQALLSVYLEDGCPGCDIARGLLAEIQAQFRQLVVSVIDIAQEGALPDDVIAVPAYVLNGTLVSLGNPSSAELRALVSRVIGEEGANGTQ